MMGLGPIMLTNRWVHKTFSETQATSQCHSVHDAFAIAVNVCMGSFTNTMQANI